MKKNLLISVNHPFISVAFFYNEIERDKIIWKDNNNLSLNLLKKIDNLLLRNELKIEMINEIKVDSLQTTYSLTRITKIIVKTINYYLTDYQKNVE